MQPILYVFPISHFSEKARWALDRAKFSYELKALVPGEHIAVLKEIATETYVPVLKLEGQVIQGSSQILNHVDIQAFGAPSNQEELEAEDKIDNQIGRGLQTMLYHFILGYPEIVGKLFQLAPPKKADSVPPPERFDLISVILRKRYKINPKNVEVVMTNMQQLTQELQSIYKERKFFNGKHFGRVDLTIASLMGSLVFPREAPATAWFESVDMPEAYYDWRKSLGVEDLFEHLRGFYKEFRTQSK